MTQSDPGGAARPQCSHSVEERHKQREVRVAWPALVELQAGGTQACAAAANEVLSSLVVLTAQLIGG